MTSEQIRSLSTEALRAIINGMDFANSDSMSRAIAAQECSRRRRA
jgi:hypothetical protein